MTEVRKRISSYCSLDVHLLIAGYCFQSFMASTAEGWVFPRWPGTPELPRLPTLKIDGDLPGTKDVLFIILDSEHKPVHWQPTTEVKGQDDEERPAQKMRLESIVKPFHTDFFNRIDYFSHCRFRQHNLFAVFYLLFHQKIIYNRKQLISKNQ